MAATMEERGHHFAGGEREVPTLRGTFSEAPTRPAKECTLRDRGHRGVSYKDFYCELCGEEVEDTVRLNCEAGRERRRFIGKSSPLCKDCFALRITDVIENCEKDLGHVGFPEFPCPIIGCTEHLSQREVLNVCDDDLRLRLRKVQNRMMCSVCAEVKRRHNLCCASDFCFDCAKRYVLMQMKEKDFVICPGGCHSSLDMDTIRRLAGEAKLAEFVQKRARSFESRLRSLLFEQNTDKSLIDSMCRHCPRCKVLIEKNQGCNDMRCMCGINFCYGCTRPHALCACSGADSSKFHALQADTFIYCWWCQDTAHSESTCPKLAAIQRKEKTRQEQHFHRNSNNNNNNRSSRSRPMSAAAAGGGGGGGIRHPALRQEGVSFARIASGRPATAAAAAAASPAPAPAAPVVESVAKQPYRRFEVDEDGWTSIVKPPRQPRQNTTVAAA